MNLDWTTAGKVADGKTKPVPGIDGLALWHRCGGGRDATATMEKLMTGASLAVMTLTVALALRADEPLPRPEYPEPQFQRENWLSLNGRWEFEFDDSNVGIDEAWPSNGKKFARIILVPFSFESKRSGIGDTSFHPWVWYRRLFTLPDSWKGRRTLLHFGAVDYKAMVWVNSSFIGGHEGGNTPFQFDITSNVRLGSNTIVVRAEDPPTDRYLPRGKQYWELNPTGIWFTRTSGIWQTVWLETVGDSYLECVRITPGSDGAVRFDGRIARPGPDLELQAKVQLGTEAAGAGKARIEGSRSSVLTFIRDPKSWSPDHPNLYEVTFELRRGNTVLDRVHSYFGFRSIRAEDGKILLNNDSIFLKMVLDQGYWPESNLTPPSDEAIQYDIRMTKNMGFNGARKHQKVEDPRYLYWADRLGLLVSSEMANAYLYDEYYVLRFTREWVEAVERDYNHPSIIIWAPINESWGVPDLRDDARQQNHLKALYALTKSLDSTRLVVDNEGWEHTNMTDLLALHDYLRTGDLLYARYKDLGKPGAPVPANLRAALLPGYPFNGSPLYLSEIGGFEYVPPGQQFPNHDGRQLETTADAALERMRSLYVAIARIPAIRGLCFTELTDVEHEIAGLMTYDRKPKMDPKLIRAINDLVR